MSRKNDRLEAVFGSLREQKMVLIDLEELDQFGSSFTAKKKPDDLQYEKLLCEFKGNSSGK